MDVKIKHTLLIVDDESINLKVLTHILGQDYTILTALNGQDGIEKAIDYRPDLILLDIIMPDMDGYQTLSLLKKSDVTKNIPVILITGLTSGEDEERGLSYDIADYITKPFNDSVVKIRVRNILKLKSAVKNAENSNRSKSVFLAKMSHEIRTLLNAILSASSGQMQNDENSQKIKDIFSQVYTSGDMMLGIINDILDMSRIESGKLELNSGEYYIAGLINDTVLLNIFKYEKKPIEFFLKIDENVPSKVFGDESRIKQILNNLLSNAFKYTASGEVELSVSVDVSNNNSDTVMLVFRVRDTGQGMMEEQLNRLFENYQRLNHEAGNKPEGAGLGMNIMTELIKKMNGEIFAKSEPGCGTLFTVRLPQKKIDSHVLGKEAVEKLKHLRVNFGSKSDKNKIERDPVPFARILVVDDVDINQYVIKEMLGFYGLEIDLASSGEEALEKIRSSNYDLVFMDQLMPGMDGFETTRKIRKLERDRSNEENKRLPVIALTANAVAGVKEVLLANGFNDFISKPVDLSELDIILKKWLNQGDEHGHSEGN